MNCPKCGQDLGFPTDGRFECRSCGWFRNPDATKKPRMLFGNELFSGRELKLHAILSIVFMALPYLVVVFLLPWLGERDPRYRLIMYPASAEWFSHHYWLILIVYLAVSALINPEPDPDAPEIHRNPIDEFLLIAAVLLMPGKWFWLSIYSAFFNRKKS